MSTQVDHPKLHLGTAPDSWGVWNPSGDPLQTPWERYLDEVVEAGYRYSELGPFGYLPKDPGIVREAYAKRGLTLIPPDTLTPHEIGFYPDDFASYIKIFFCRPVHGVKGFSGDAGLEKWYFQVILDAPILVKSQFCSGYGIKHSSAGILNSFPGFVAAFEGSPTDLPVGISH